MSEEEKQAIEELKKQYKLSMNIDCITTDIRNEYAETVLNLIEKQQEQLQEKDITIATLKHLNQELQNDFENYKNNKDIHYLDGIHHKKLVEKSIGQEIKEPENIDFEDVECKLVIQNKIIEGMQIANELEILDVGGTKEREYPRFLNLKDIADYIEKNNFYFGTVIAESPLSGAIYRYNNYGKKEWQLVGTMLGYA